MISYLDVDGNLSPDCHHHISDDELVRGYQVMLMTRQIDDRMITLQRQGAISFAMSSYGEEGCVVASAAALQPQDWLYPQYREDGIMFWRGFTPQQYIHHMFGNAKDVILGRQMPNHFGSRELNVVTVSSPLATQIPHAAGCAYAMKLNKENAVAVSYFGEGTTSKGDFHAGINFAALRQVPAIFFCRNNGYAISTKTCNQYATPDIASKGQAYGITTFKIDGNDYFAVHETVSKARDLCIEGAGPILIEAVTYRLGAHSTSDDPSVYRDDKEVEEWKKRDPVLRLSRYLKHKKLWDDDKEKMFLEELKQEVDEAIKIAKATPPPALSTIVQDVYFDIPPKLQREYEGLKTFFPEAT